MQLSRPSVASKCVIAVIRVYQRLISPLLGPRCRFYPSCSAYMIEAIEKLGLIRGLAKGMWRLARCNPFSPGGYDPVVKDPS